MLVELRKVTGILLLFLAACSSLFSAPALDTYTKHVQAISYQAAGDQTIAVIQLSDGTSWNFSVGTLEQGLLADIEEDMPPGTEVRIKPNFTTPQYRLLVQKSGGNWISYRVGITKDTKRYTSNKILKIEKVLLKKGGWFTSDVFGHHVYLTDGSVWEANQSSYRQWALEKWQPNDKIIVTQLIEREWCLLNIDANHQDGYDNDYRLLYNIFPVAQ